MTVATAVSNRPRVAGTPSAVTVAVANRPILRDPGEAVRSAGAGAIRKSMSPDSETFVRQARQAPGE